MPNFEQEFVLQTDASNDEIGAILLQEELGVKHPVAFASRKLLLREVHYSTIEKECVGYTEISEFSLWQIFYFGN